MKNEHIKELKRRYHENDLNVECVKYALELLDETKDFNQFIDLLSVIMDLLKDDATAPTPMVDVNHVMEKSFDFNNIEVGGEFQLAEEMRLRIDTMSDGKVLWIPLFTSYEEIDKGNTANIRMEVPMRILFEDAFNRDDIEGIVINPFSDGFELKKEILKEILNVVEAEGNKTS